MLSDLLCFLCVVILSILTVTLLYLYTVIGLPALDKWIDKWIDKRKKRGDA